MLIRFVLNNMFSFGEEKEFNMFPAARIRGKKEHKYSINKFDILKMASIYGANGAGKSNLIKALDQFKEIIIKEEVPARFSENAFKFNDEESQIPQTLVIEFFQENISFLYGLEILNDIIITEELYISGLGKHDDKLLFERKTDRDTKKITIISELLDKDDESRVLKTVIEKNLSKPDKPIFKLLTTLDNPHLGDIATALKWFEDTLRIVTPNARPNALAHSIDNNIEFKKYVEDTMKSFYIGIDSVKSEKKNIQDFFGEDNSKLLDDLIKKVKESPNKAIGLHVEDGDELVIVEEKDEIFVKQLQIEHIGKNNKKAIFDLNEESDGTVRLLDFMPAFQGLLNEKKVFIIDEIERSIHPLLIKELIRKFSDDIETNGQLIFTTHESNLLDQSIFRQDEIWFSEKNKDGCTDLYSLSDFKEHNTIDIRKGYLTGRYGSIPFLGNLKDLNWHQYDIEK